MAFHQDVVKLSTTRPLDPKPSVGLGGPYESLKGLP